MKRKNVTISSFLLIFFKNEIFFSALFIDKNNVSVEVQLKDGQTMAEIEEENRSSSPYVIAQTSSGSQGGAALTRDFFARYSGIAMTEEDADAWNSD